MPRRQKEASAPENDNEALMLLQLQKQVQQLTEARATLTKVMALVRETPLHNFTSAQDRRTLNTAQSCLDSLSIRLTRGLFQYSRAHSQTKAIDILVESTTNDL